jgi:hypothetical protein
MTQVPHPDQTATGVIAAGAASSGTPGTTGIARSARPLPVLQAGRRACSALPDRGDRRKEICDCGLTEDPPWCDGTCGD